MSPVFLFLFILGFCLVTVVGFSKAVTSRSEFGFVFWVAVGLAPLVFTMTMGTSE